MNNSRTMRTTFIVAAIVALSFSICFAGKKKAESKAEKASSKIADAGSFGIYINGKRVATEKFRIEQSENGGIATSELTTDQGENVRQTAELQIAPNGDLQRYTWRESSPEKSQLVAEPSEEFVVLNITPAPPEKPSLMTLMLSTSAPVLDDYFFSQREILIWRYMAQACGSTITSNCTLPKTQFGVLVPRQHTSATVSTEYKGKEKVTVKGSERTLDHFIINFEGIEWDCYLDENMKLVIIEIPTDKTEVVRD